MMGRAHSISGAAAWLGLCTAAANVGHRPDLPTIAAGAVICAGGALLPDLDLSGKVTSCQGGATVAHTFGVASLFVAECVEKASLAVYNLTRSKADPHKENGHRTATHCLAFNVAAGIGIYELCAHLGRWAVLGVLFVAFACALRGLAGDRAKRAGWLAVTTASAIAAVGAYFWLPRGHDYGLLGAALGVGGIAHILGDALTSQGCPLLWPVPIAGRRWYPVGPPKRLRFHAGSRVEHWVVVPALFIASACAVWALA
jgi:membrane-bound metal-dependent hydrolase YbcI (DUF457 family)